MSELVAIYPLRFFYWQVEFEDGYVASQFDKDGNETFIKDFAAKECFYDTPTGKAIDMKKNVWALLESVQGRAVKVSWVPFTEDLKTKIESKQKASIVTFKDAKPIVKSVPADSFPFFAKHLDINYGVTNKLTAADEWSGYESILEIGYISRTGKEPSVIDTINIKPKEVS